METITEAEMVQYKVVAGTFHVKGYKPDGDSIRFKARNPLHWDSFKWKDAKRKKSAHKQLRIEAIDALETHYEGYQQPRPFALAALESLLELLGITEVKYSLSVTQIVDAGDGTPGFIASAELDGNDRPISYVFPATASLTDGAMLPPDQLPIDDSINFILARMGLVYPTFYTTTDRAIAEKLRTVVGRARATKRGIWAIDRTNDFTIWDTRTIQEDIVIMPKMFRRLVSFFEGHGDFDGLEKYMRAQRDNLKMWDGTKHRSLADLMTFEGRRLKLNARIEDILFNPKA